MEYKLPEEGKIYCVGQNPSKSHIWIIIQKVEGRAVTYNYLYRIGKYSPFYTSHMLVAPKDGSWHPTGLLSVIVTELPLYNTPVGRELLKLKYTREAQLEALNGPYER